MKKTASHVVFLALALVVVHAFAEGADTSTLRLEPYRHCSILARKPETRPWLYENLRKYLKGNESKQQEPQR